MGASCEEVARALLPGCEWPYFPGSEPASRTTLGTSIPRRKTARRYDHDKYEALRFKIVLTEANKQQWLELLGGTGLARKPVGVSIAMVDLFEPGKTEIMPTAINPAFVEAPEWQKVSLKASTDWLTGAAGLLLPVILHCSFTMPLPRRFFRTWLRTASGT